MEAYCMKCNGKKEMKNPAPVTMKNSKTSTEDTCADCGTKTFRIGALPK